jgi:peroxiredoxin
VELEGRREELKAQGLAVAALSYDARGVLADFARRRGIRFPLLSDPGSAIIRRLGLLDPAYVPGETSGGPQPFVPHGVPYAVTFLLDADGRVTRKLVEPTYRQRPTAGSLLALSGPPGAEAREIRTDHFTLRAWASSGALAPGQRSSLVLDFEMAPGRHAYAPGAQGYRSLSLQLELHPLLTVHEPVYPPSRPYHFKPLAETVPVFEGRFRLVQDVTLVTGAEVDELLKAPRPRVEVKGTVSYQVCSDTLCYPPGSLPVSFAFEVVPLDRERARPAAAVLPRPGAR